MNSVKILMNEFLFGGVSVQFTVVAAVTAAVVIFAVVFSHIHINKGCEGFDKSASDDDAAMSAPDSSD